MKTFYSELGVGHEKGSVGRAWVCLDPVAQAPFKSVDGLQAYGKSRTSELGQYALRATEHVWSNHRPNRPDNWVQRWIDRWSKPPVEPSWEMTVGEPAVQTVSERAAEVTFDLSITVFEDHQPQDTEKDDPLIVCYGILELRQSKTLLKVEDRWYLTSGTLDGPNDGQPTAEQSDPAQDVAPA